MVYTQALERIDSVLLLKEYSCTCTTSVVRVKKAVMYMCMYIHDCMSVAPRDREKWGKNEGEKEMAGEMEGEKERERGRGGGREGEGGRRERERKKKKKRRK